MTKEITEYDRMVNSARKLYDKRNADNSYELEGIQIKICLPVGQSLATHKSPNIIGLLGEIEKHDPKFTSPFSSLPKEIADNLNQGDVTDQGSMLYCLHLGSLGDNQHTHVQYTIIYQEGNPLIETFNIGFQEGSLIRQCNNEQFIIELWNQQKRLLLDNTHSSIISMGSLGALESGLRNQVLSNLAAIYALVLKYEPEIAIKEASKGSGTYGFYQALVFLGMKGPFDYFESEDVNQLREEVEGEFFEIPEED